MTASLVNMTGSELAWQELDHIALATRDLDQTVQFYTEVLGMQAESIKPPNPIHGRTCLIKAGPIAKVELHFFEQADAQPLSTHPEILQRLIFPSVGLHHIAFLLPDAETGQQLQERLQSRGIVMTPVMDQGGSYNFLFQDNNGLVIEANWRKR
jgi:catechol 2,3-dioxygenase-like lactoylglutathione lyase family enzyme